VTSHLIKNLKIDYVVEGSATATR